MQENINQPFTKKQLIFPIIAIGIFILLVGSASYAYFTQSIGSATGAANIANGNAVNPRGCSFVSAATNCVITANNQFTLNYADNYVSFMEMQQAYNGNKVANTSCRLNITVNGNQGCTCSYSVHLAGMYNMANLSGIENTITANVTSTNTSHSKTTRNITTVGALVINNTLSVATTGTAVKENFTVVVNVYNRNANQDFASGRKFVYYLAAYPTCYVGADTAHYAFGDVGPSDATSYASLTYPSTSTTARVFTRYLYGKKYVCALAGSNLLCLEPVDTTVYNTEALYGQAMWDRYYQLQQECTAAGGSIGSPDYSQMVPASVGCYFSSQNLQIACDANFSTPLCFATDGTNNKTCRIINGGVNCGNS